MVAETVNRVAGAASHDEAPAEAPKSARIASGGIHHSGQAKEFLSSLIGDVMNDRVAPRTASTAVNAMGKLLKVVEMEHKYGRPESQDKQLAITAPADDPLEREAEALRARLATIEAARKG